MRLKVKCWQCGRKRVKRGLVSRYDGRSVNKASDEFRRDLNLSGWFLWQRGMRFCPTCAVSAKLALGVIVAAGKIG